MESDKYILYSYTNSGLGGFLVKNVVIMLTCGMLGGLSLAIVMTICGSMNRRVEIQSNLSSAIEQTVEATVTDVAGAYDDNLALAECMECIGLALDTDSEVTLSVYQADIKKGVLALGIRERFKHPNGTEGTAEWKRSVIYDTTEESQDTQYKVSFYLNKQDMLCEERTYKTYVLQEGNHILEPVSPEAEERTFAGWRDVNDYIADFSQPVQQNLTYYAAWE